jgi:hypothetical protein
VNADTLPIVELPLYDSVGEFVDDQLEHTCKVVPLYLSFRIGC